MTTGAMKVKNRQISDIQVQIKALKKGKFQGLDTLFVDVAKRRLQPEVFQEYLEEAKELLEEKQYGGTGDAVV